MRDAAQVALFLGLAAATVLALGACAETSSGHNDSRVRTMDEQRGTHRGLRLGMTESRAIRRRGSGEPLTGTQAPTPDDVDPTSISAPTSHPSDWTARSYPRLVIQFQRGVVVGFGTTDSSARTRAGLRIGQALDEVRKLYRGVRCDRARLGESSTFVSYCAGRLRSGGGVWFGGDPIYSIWVVRGLGSQLPRRGVITPR